MPRCYGVPTLPSSQLGYTAPAIAPSGGRTAQTADNIRDVIEQVLFTSPGERINRPNFGTELM